ncbi:uncharacterized protein LOC131251623 [Magnolia sinica]|uniref:uncharacterized protein LOC131251623 n=1 Tax=Magnolia sinica TaxID=86752 RepID=UPI00265A1687|nr:uncharacterized protein LOC131251623 [Magnolia sinica]
MADSVDIILDFLKRNRFTRAEAALRGELSTRSDLNGLIANPLSEPKDSKNPLQDEKHNEIAPKRLSVGAQSSEISTELIVKEVECGNSRNGSDSKWKIGSSSENTSSDIYSWNFDPSERNSVPKDDGAIANNFSELKLSGPPSNSHIVLVPDRKNPAGVSKSGYGVESDLSGEKRMSWVGSTSKAENVDQPSKTSSGYAKDQPVDNPWSVSAGPMKTSYGAELDLSGEKRMSWVGSMSKPDNSNQACKPSSSFAKDQPLDNQWLISGGSKKPSSDSWKECSVVKTVFPFPMVDVTSNYDGILGSSDNRKEGKQNDIRAELKEQVDEVGRSLFLGKPQGTSEHKNVSCLDLVLVNENRKEELPRLPPVKLKSEDKSANIHWEEKADRRGSGMKMTSEDNTFLIGSFLDVPIGQEINSSGGKRTGGNSWLSVSQGIAEDASDLVSGFATIGDGLSESIDYPNEYWDSDEYDDDDDVGYMRQPIEDEAWFLAHEIDYPSDNEKGTGHGSVPDRPERGPMKDEDDDQSFAEEDSYFSGEQFFQANTIEQVAASEDPIGLSIASMYGRRDENDLIAQYDGQLMDEEELNLMRAEPVWQGFVTQNNELIMLGNGQVLNECERPRPDDLCMDDDQHGSVRSIGVGINSDAADIGSEVRESLVGGSSEGDVEYFCDHDVGIGSSKRCQQETNKSHLERSNRDKTRASEPDRHKYIMGPEKDTVGVSYNDGGFSFPPPLGTVDGMQADSGKQLWSSKGDMVMGEETDDYGNGLIGPDDMLATWRRKSTDSSPVKSSSRDENIGNVVRSNSTSSTLSDYGDEKGHVKEGRDDKVSDAREEDPGATIEDEEAVAVQEQVRQIKAQEDEFETFNLKIVHRKNRTGFEEDKNFHVVLNSVIAGRYHVTEYLGSAAFSKAIQAHDLHTGMDVCVKIIKNNKDFFDQSLDEIKLLKFVNKNDPADKYHILRLYDYFYYREHLLIVCELLKANLYEFHKFNRESGGEVYFTMPRLQSITIQCLEALQFLHGLGLIHCDLKPENILVKSYSRCEVKVIDLGSSCFQTDHLCSYVQSRSYRAPEVILGLPYDKKIDIWSLGCILAELCTGNVLFQNDSPATLLARVIGIIGSIDQDMLAKGRDTYKYFTKNHMLYERNQDTNRLEYLIPKKTSLRHRLPMGDQGFIDFVAHLLEINPKKRPTASEALKHSWLSYPYEPISS